MVLTDNNAKRKFKKVAVLLGGISSEREVSIRSGKAVATALAGEGYEVAEIDVNSRQINIPAGIEAVFIALHGEFGEDGEVQSLLESMEIPYTGSGPKASWLSFNKSASKKIFEKKGIPSPCYEILQKGQKRSIPLPLVVKPSLQGSSIGVHIVKKENEWMPAANDAFKYGDEILVEAFVPGRELTVGIVGHEALPAIEIVAKEGWYDYKAKYTKGYTEYIVPAVIDEEHARRCADIALQTFNAIGCSDMGRVDFRMTPEGELFVLELNNIPGFTETSLLPKAALCAGLKFGKLCATLIEMAACGNNKH